LFVGVVALLALHEDDVFEGGLRIAFPVEQFKLFFGQGGLLGTAGVCGLEWFCAFLHGNYAFFKYNSKSSIKSPHLSGHRTQQRLSEERLHLLTGLKGSQGFLSIVHTSH
jgi:hypothetical protein